MRVASRRQDAAGERRPGVPPAAPPAAHLPRTAFAVAWALALVLALALALATTPATAATPSREQALAEAFPGARIETRNLVMTDAQLAQVRSAARVPVRSKIVSAYLAWRGDTLAGAAFFDSRTVRTMPAVFLVVVAPDTTIERVEVVAFHEPPDYRPPARWLGLFRRHRLDDGLWPRRDIRNLAGATLSARAATESARLALALYQTLVAPAVGGTTPRVTGPR